jgi:hypothetical protein
MKIPGRGHWGQGGSGYDRSPCAEGAIQMTTLTLRFESIRMEEHRSCDCTESRHFDFRDVYLDSGALELETGEVLGGSLGNNSTISASLQFRLAEQEGPLSEMQYWPRIGPDNSRIGPFITFDIFASSSHFGELVTNVRHGLVPRTISIELAEDPKFWRIDDPLMGRWSKRVWRNEMVDSRGCSGIPINTYAFSYVIKDAHLNNP